MYKKISNLCIFIFVVLVFALFYFDYFDGKHPDVIVYLLTAVALNFIVFLFSTALR